MCVKRARLASGWDTVGKLHRGLAFGLALGRHGDMALEECHGCEVLRWQTSELRRMTAGQNRRDGVRVSGESAELYLYSVGASRAAG